MFTVVNLDIHLNVMYSFFTDNSCFVVSIQLLFHLLINLNGTAPFSFSSSSNSWLNNGTFIFHIYTFSWFIQS
jgi:hypothetical protein